MRNFKDIILEKLKVTKNNSSGIFKPSEECAVHYNDFTQALEKYGEFELSEIFGDNLPKWDENNTIVSIDYYKESNYIIATLMNKDNEKYNHYIATMNALKYRLGNKDTLVGNTVVTEIYDLIS